MEDLPYDFFAVFHIRRFRNVLFPPLFPDRFRGLRVTGSKRGDALAVLIMSQLRKTFPNKVC